MPGANRFTIGIMAQIAQWEAKINSKRIKLALAETKKNGTLLGSNRLGHWQGIEDKRRAGGEKGRAQALKNIQDKTKGRDAFLWPQIKELRQQELSCRAIADALNKRNRKSRRGNKINAMLVSRI